MANEALGEGKCVVIGLQSTGDSRTKQMVQRRAEEDEEDEKKAKPSFCNTEP